MERIYHIIGYRRFKSKKNGKMYTLVFATRPAEYDGEVGTACEHFFLSASSNFVPQIDFPYLMKVYNQFCYSIRLPAGESDNLLSSDSVLDDRD